MEPSGDFARLLAECQQGNDGALERLVPLVYQELRALARSYLRRERRDHTLQATALVHELFIRLAAGGRTEWHDRQHFFGIAARAMRQILVAHARRHRAAKRGGGSDALPLDGTAEPSAAAALDLDSLDAALSSLAEHDRLQARIVELRFFGGYTLEETARLVGCSPATVSREWRLARIWLFREMRRGPHEAS